MRTSLLAASAISLALGGCSASMDRHVSQASAPMAAPNPDVAPSASSPVAGRRIPSSSVHLGPSAGAQILRLQWSRPGTWTNVSLMGPEGEYQGLVARDRMGVRIVTAPNANGYLVSQVMLDCAGGRARIASSRFAPMDMGPVDLTGPGAQARFRILPSHVAEICALPQTMGTTSAASAVAGLRTQRRSIAESRQSEVAGARAEGRRQLADRLAQAKAQGYADPVDPKVASEAREIAKRTGKPVVVVRNVIMDGKHGSPPPLPDQSRLPPIPSSPSPSQPPPSPQP